jgi:methyl-accepting chemotaxis protein
MNTIVSSAVGGRIAASDLPGDSRSMVSEMIRTERRVLIGLWANFALALGFWVWLAILPVGALVLIALALTCATTALHFFSGPSTLSKFANTALLVYYFSIFVYGSYGQESMHFHFAFTMTVIGLYSDWRLVAFISILYAVHHAAFVYFEPELIFRHAVQWQGSLFGPWQTFLIHGLAVVIVAIPLAVQVAWSRSKISQLDDSAAGIQAQHAALSRADQIKQSAAESITHSMQSLTESTRDSSAAFEEMVTTFHEISRSSEAQSDQVKGVNSSMKEIGTRVDRFSNHAGETIERVQTLNQSVSAGLESIATLQERLSRLSDLSSTFQDAARNLNEQQSQIEDILATISKISDSTNLLSLNASIEAARAGEHGRGFSIVAEEINRLAEQSGTAVKNIGSIVRAGKTETDGIMNVLEQNSSTVDSLRIVSDQSAEHFESIKQMQENLTEFTDETLALVGDLGSNVGQVTSRLDSIAAASQQTAKGAEELLAAVNSLFTRLEQNGRSLQAIEDQAARLSRTGDGPAASSGV